MPSPAHTHTHVGTVCSHFTLMFPSPVLFSTVIGKPVKAFWETCPCSQGKASRQKILKCITFSIFSILFFVFFGMWCAVQSWVGASHAPEWRGQSSSHIALRCLPTSVPDGYLVGSLEFNADECWLTSWEINVTHQAECSCSAGWRHLDLLLFLWRSGWWLDSCVFVCVCGRIAGMITVYEGVCACKVKGLRHVSVIFSHKAWPDVQTFPIGSKSLP